MCVCASYACHEICFLGGFHRLFYVSETALALAPAKLCSRCTFWACPRSGRDVWRGRIGLMRLLRLFRSLQFIQTINATTSLSTPDALESNRSCNVWAITCKLLRDAPNAHWQAYTRSHQPTSTSGDGRQSTRCGIPPPPGRVPRRARVHGWVCAMVLAQRTQSSIRCASRGGCGTRVLWRRGSTAPRRQFSAPPSDSPTSFPCPSRARARLAARAKPQEMRSAVGRVLSPSVL
ncbi:hypothetical protein C2E23DRAFT_358439 [Lenzites betulinus]|nr:hypothetical protein C2E23DRAFT_358439 [Lenzites betulinus]